MDPMVLITEKLKVNPNAIKCLEEDKRPVTVITIVGKYRTGKSYLLNRIMGNKNKGFPLGSTVQAKTKGIWFWKGDFFGDPSRALVLLDTEGFGDTEKGDASYDMNLFSLAILLSSVLVFNTLGTIDNKSIDELHFATKISQLISANSEKKDQSNNEDLSQHFPNFIWAVRDHHLTLEIDGKVVTANDYLENCLKEKSGFTEEIAKYNNLRSAIKAYFPNRSCHVFPIPAKRSNQMKDLEHLQEKELSEEFNAAGANFIQHLKSCAKTKRIKGTIINASSFGLLAETYAQSVLERNICIESTYQFMTEKVNLKASNEAIQELNKKFEQLSKSFPLSLTSFETHSKEAHSTACKRFLELAFSIDEHSVHFKKFAELVEVTLDGFYHKNCAASTGKCQKLLASLFQVVEGQARQGAFLVPGGHATLQKEIDNVVAKFLSTQGQEELGPEMNSVLHQFQNDKMNPILDSTLWADKLLTKQEKEMKKAEMERKKLEDEAKITRENLKITHNLFKEAESLHKKGMELLEEKLKSDHDKRIKDLKQEMELKRQEMQTNHTNATKEMQKKYSEDLSRLSAQIAELNKPRPPVVIPPRIRRCTLM